MVNLPLYLNYCNYFFTVLIVLLEISNYLPGDQLMALIVLHRVHTTLNVEQEELKKYDRYS